MNSRLAFPFMILSIRASAMTLHWKYVDYVVLLQKLLLPGSE